MGPINSATEESLPARQPSTRLHGYAAAELARAIACLGWRGARLHAGVHQARKSLRRTRATIALGGSALGPGAVLIDRELRRLNRRLSKLRDAQALVGTLDHLLRKASKENGDADSSPVLRRARRVAAHARAERARASLSDDPQLRDKRSLLTVLQAALSALPWSEVGENDVHAALHRSVARLDAAAARAQLSGRDEDWHGWRRRARRLSQQQRALGNSVPAAADVEERIKHLAVLLGEAQDYALLREHCGKRSEFARIDRDVLRRLSERGMARLRERVAKSLPAAQREGTDPRFRDGGAARSA